MPRLLPVLASWIVTVTLAGVGVVLASSASSHSNPPARGMLDGSDNTLPTSTVVGPEAPRWVATAIVPSVAAFANPDATTPTEVLANPTPRGGPLVFLVAERPATGADRISVYLPVRPNGSTGWVSTSDVDITLNPYRIEVAVAAHRLTLWHEDQVVMEEPIGVGTADTPTPGGTFYVAELLQPPDPNGPYGPYAYGLSGFSDVVLDFNGGEGVIGIHGTDDPSAIGADVSRGCIRLPNEAIVELVSFLPLGTPVEIRR